MYAIAFHRRAEQALERLDPVTAERIGRAISRLRESPFSRDIKKLKGQFAGAYRLRVGQYRIVFEIQQERNRIIIEAIAHRGNIY